MCAVGCSLLVVSCLLCVVCCVLSDVRFVCCLFVVCWLLFAALVFDV